MRFSRTEMLIGKEGMARLKNARVAVFGVGGVGGYAAEALARSGVGALELIDADTVSLSNINRQIIATEKTVGAAKVEAAAARLKEINPALEVVARQVFFMPDNAETFDFSTYDYVIDAIDTVTAKIELAVRAEACGTPIISSMGAGNKLDPTRFEVADIYQTSVCPLARVMRRELKKRGVKALKTVYSKEEPIEAESGREEEHTSGKRAPGSVAFVPSVAGLIIAGEVIKDLAGINKK
ncbi:MAG: tRNA threonylcarbamoyladenosine dehydratase [Clostridia bacterium]|nr:tRNA threonylcarbamoyladenosine dehydratase [Clostridia bacterium]